MDYSKISFGDLILNTDWVMPNTSTSIYLLVDGALHNINRSYDSQLRMLYFIMHCLPKQYEYETFDNIYVKLINPTNKKLFRLLFDKINENKASSNDYEFGTLLVEYNEYAKETYGTDNVYARCVLVPHNCDSINKDTLLSSITLGVMYGKYEGNTYTDYMYNVATLDMLMTEIDRLLLGWGIYNPLLKENLNNKKSEL